MIPKHTVTYSEIIKGFVLELPLKDGDDGILQYFERDCSTCFDHNLTYCCFNNDLILTLGTRLYD